MTDYAVPNAEWSKESLKLFNELSKLTISEESGWQKLKSNPFNNHHDGSVNFLRPMVEQPGKIFEYAFFINENLMLLKGVVQFGLYTRGPPGHVHGGATGTILDAVMGVLFCEIRHTSAVTANMNINFKRGIPLNSTALVEAKVEKIEGRKGFVSAIIKSPTEDIIYADSTTLYIETPARL